MPRFADIDILGVRHFLPECRNTAIRYDIAQLSSHDQHRNIGALPKLFGRVFERFAKLAPHLDEELGTFYTSLLKSESRHYRDYLALAREAAGGASVDDRIAHFLALERELIESPDDALRFHSGPPGGARPTRRNSKQAGA